LAWSWEKGINPDIKICALETIFLIMLSLTGSEKFINRRCLNKPMELTREVLDTALDKGIEFLATKGITIKERPEIILMPKPHPYLRRVAETDMSFPKLDIRAFESDIIGLQTLYKGIFGIELSKKAIAEMFPPNIGKIPLIRKAGYKPEIRLYPIILQKASELEDVAEILVHELWHNVESQHPITARTQSIREGIATYVQLNYRGVEIKRPLESYNKFDEIVACGLAYIVQEHLKDKKNPYRAILQHATRKKIEEEGLKRIFEHSGLLLKAAAKEMKRRIGENKPGSVTMEVLQEPTEKKIISIYRRQGANRLADELERQDLSRLLAFYTSFKKPEERK